LGLISWLAKNCKLVFLTFLLLVQLFILPAEIECSQGFLVVPDDFSSIQEAIDHATDGDTILVRKGVYYECVKITKSLKLVGEQGAIIQSTGGWHTVEVNHDNVVLENFVINGTGASPWSGIMVENQANVTLSNNTIINHYFGVHFYDSFNNKMYNNTLVNNTYNLEVWGLFLSHFIHTIDTSNKVNGKPVYYWVGEKSRKVPSDAGYVGIVNSESILVKDLNLTGNGEGVLLAYTENSVIINVNVSYNRNGFRLVSSNNNFIVGNKICKNEFCGLILAASSNNLIASNDFSGQTRGITLSYSPILNLSSDNNVIGGNNFHNHSFSAFSLHQVANNKIFANTLSNNTYAFYITSSKNNTVYHNIFLQSSTISIDAASKISWNTSYPSGGNYWSDYTGVDFYSGIFQNVTGSDGIGDAPYVIDELNIDHYPLMNLPSFEQPFAVFTWSPVDVKVLDQVRFIDQSLSATAILFRLWLLNDSFFIQRSEIACTFNKPGNYPITLVVVNEDGRLVSLTKNLNVRKIQTALTISCNSSIVSLGETVEISTYLESEEGSPIPNASITFHILNVSMEISTDFNGSTKIVFKPNQTETLQILAVFSGTEIYSSSKASINLTVTATPSQLESWKIIVVATAILSLSVLVLFLHYKTRKRSIPKTEKD